MLAVLPGCAAACPAATCLTHSASEQNKMPPVADLRSDLVGGMARLVQARPAAAGLWPPSLAKHDLRIGSRPADALHFPRCMEHWGC